jgi:hypothetical protein
MIKKQAKWLLPLLMLCVVACQKDISTPSSRSLNTQSNSEVEACGDPVVYPLTDQGGVHSGGNATISNDEENVYIKVDAKAGTFLTQVSWFAGSFDDVSTGVITVNPCDPANPDGQVSFDLSAAETSFTITIPVTDLIEGCIWLQVFATTNDSEGSMELCSGISTVDGATQIGSGTLQAAVEYCKQDCPPDEECGPGRTQTPGGWGAPPNGNNPGAYLHANFEDAFGELVIGCGGNTITLTTAQAITNLLPTGGKAATISGAHINPASISNVLVGHLVALTLSVGFDAFDEDFSEGGVDLGDMVIVGGTFDGWTVSDFLATANQVIGGCSTEYTIQQILTTASAINENFVDGKIDNGAVECPE